MAKTERWIDGAVCVSIRRQLLICHLFRTTIYLNLFFFSHCCFPFFAGEDEPNVLYFEKYYPQKM